MIIITDLAKYCDHFHRAEIEPRRKELSNYMKKRIQQVKEINSRRGASMESLEKANTEQNFINAIIDMDVIHTQLLNSVNIHIHKCIQQYATYINKGGQLEAENQFLRERVAHLEKREDEWIQIFKEKFSK